MSGCKRKIVDFEFTQAEIDEAVRDNRLLSIEIEFSLICNSSCPYCYMTDDFSPKNELSKEELMSCITQAKEMGAKRIIILGGEPLIYPHIIEMLSFIRRAGLEVQVFTNGLNINDALARQMFELGANVVLKMNSFKPDVQDMLTGIKGSFGRIRDSLKSLKNAGYPSEENGLAVSTVICKQNEEEIVGMWEWLREQGITPYIEIITPQGRASNSRWMDIESHRLQEIFQSISDIDREKYGIEWDPQPPLVGNKCLRHKYSCMISSNGDVLSCVGLTMPLGNIKEMSLKEILSDSEIISALKKHTENIKGPCAECSNSETCYGCRGAAYQLTGDYLASDPLCWKNIDRQSEIVRLPFEVKDIIPQKQPMRVIDKLTRVAERTFDAVTTIREDSLFARPDGTVDESIYIELMAQATASINGFENMREKDKAIEGFLLGAKKLKVFSGPRVGDELKINIFKYAEVGEFKILQGKVYRGDELLASGEIKVWQSAVSKGTKKTGEKITAGEIV